MKRIIIGTIVATIIFFAFESVMWMGGFHRNFYTYTPGQDTILQSLSRNLGQDGMYMMPMADANSPDFKTKQAELEKKMPGNPWAMVFYHRKMADFSGAFMLVGMLYTLLACLIATLVLFYTDPGSFWKRFLVSMAFALFTLVLSVLPQMNWWSFPWHFVSTQVTDVLIGWVLVSVWMAFYVKKKVEKTVS
jgi:hypothetical protein